MAKKRSPNYPSISLPKAIELARNIFPKLKDHRTDKESIAELLGYKSLSGRALSVLATLSSYGILDGRGDDTGLTPDAIALAHEPHDPEERKRAIFNCALSPPLFQQIDSHFKGELPGEVVLRSYLNKNGFSIDASNRAIKVIMETFDYLKGIDNKGNKWENTDNISFEELDEEEEVMGESAMAQATGSANIAIKPRGALVGEKELFSYEFEPAGSIRLMVSGDVDTDEALDVLLDLVEMKKKELERKRKRGERTSEPSEGDDSDPSFM